MIKRQKGITLIALVITIIVILILSAVSISVITGENGVLTQASNAVIENRGASVQEARDFWHSELEMDEKIGTTEGRTLAKVLSELKEQGLLTEDEIKKIKETGEITIGSRTIIFGIPEKTEEEMKAEYSQIIKWIPIYTRDHLEKVGSGETITIDGTEYKFEYGANIGYILKNDIDLSERNFTPLPNLTAGVFLGNNKTINNMTINQGSSNIVYIGLFEENYGTISYIKLVNSNIIVNNGNSDNGSRSYIGGIVGNNNVGGAISNCYNTGSIKVNSSSYSTIVGGIVGINEGNSTKNSTISNCYNISSLEVISSNRYLYIGGIVGCSNYGKVTNCYNTGNTQVSNTANDTSSVTNVGGIVGWSVNRDIIEKSYNTGNVKASAIYYLYVGGNIGQNASTAKINNCYNIGSIEVNGGKSIFLGGILGFIDGTVSNCYNTGLTTKNGGSTVTMGGFVGAVRSGANITNCYYLSGIITDSNAEEKTLYELKSLAGTLGEDWKNDTKNINNGYPILSWQ